MSVNKTGATQVSDAIELSPTQHIMPKTLSNDCISTAFEETTEALNNSKLLEVFLKRKKENEIINEIVDLFDKKTHILQGRVTTQTKKKLRTFLQGRITI